MSRRRAREASREHPGDRPGAKQSLAGEWRLPSGGSGASAEPDENQAPNEQQGDGPASQSDLDPARFRRCLGRWVRQLRLLRVQAVELRLDVLAVPDPAQL